VKIAAIVARILLGLIFLAAGASNFIFINNPPPAPPGMATAFMDVYFASRWALFVGGIEIIAAVLLLVNRYVPLALVLAAAVIYNMCVFHITMMPIGLPGPLLLLILGLIVASRHRAAFAPLFEKSS